MKRFFPGFGLFLTFFTPLFLVIPPATPASSQNKAGDSKLWDPKRLGHSFYCNSHLSQVNSLETSVIGNWCLLNWSPQIVTGTEWEIVIRPASSLLLMFCFKGPFRLSMEVVAIKSCSKALKSCSSSSTSFCSCVTSSTQTHSYTHWTHIHTHPYINIYMEPVEYT